MIKRILSKFGYVPRETMPLKNESELYKPRQRFTSDDNFIHSNQEKIEKLWDINFQNAVHPSMDIDEKQKMHFAMDNNLNIKAPYQVNYIIPEPQVLWYANQTFIGYQLCAMLAQQWLISKACLMPAKDATRNGYEITVNDGTDVAPEVLDYIRKQDNTYRLNHNLIQFVQMGRIFGIRVAMFIIESDDPDYYKNPFNPDGVLPGSYKGISQVDPYWMVPQLDVESSGNPASINFYEPTWWIINGKPIHRTHLIIYKTEEVADILKPSYIWGGVPIPQKIAERVYAAEITANEAPKLALTKRTDVLNIDLTESGAQPCGLVNRIQQWVFNRDNYGIKTLGLDETMTQFDTSLTDLDAVIMTQYQIVAAACNVPAVKLMGTTPKGFNSTGEFEEANYHEELESIQTHDLSPLIERHHLLLIRSEVAPKFGIEPFTTAVTWNQLDAMTAKEQVEVNKWKAEAGRYLLESGAISPTDERQRLIADKNSGYSGLREEVDEIENSVFSDLTGG